MLIASKKAFTLVELVVVIAIIAILTTVSIVGYNTFVKDANKSKAEQELSQLKNSLIVKATSGDIVITDDNNNSLTLSVTNNTITLEFNFVYDSIKVNNLFNNLLTDLELSSFTSKVSLQVTDSGSFITHVDHEDPKIEVNTQFEQTNE